MAKLTEKIVAITGNAAVAQAMRQINPDVVAAYPITPQTDIAETFAEFVADGLVDTEYVTVESEHSAMSACVGASAAGARVMTATSSQGLALMWEILYIAAGMRLPITMTNVNRCLSAPINIHCDHSDSMGARDSGWIQIYSENAQEAYDNVIQAIRIAEHKSVLLPVMVNMDGFIVSHSIERVELLDDEVVKRFVGEYKPVYPLLDVENPVTHGPFDGLGGFYFEHKKAQIEAIERSRKVVLDVADEFKRISGREYGCFEPYRLDDAEVALVVLNSAAGTSKCVVDAMREEGYPVGILKLRVFRPFLARELSEALKHLKAVAILERATSPGSFGPLYAEIRSALYDLEARPKMVNLIYGLGGREFRPEHAKEAFGVCLKVAQTKRVEKPLGYLGLKEVEVIS
ncbi:MAG: pyruvate ferredoxin oxidoreductase [Actinomycetota bacterium]|nr:pyruvate ferredoxin oxidoreductase [Actinomycetota bacterium]